jgi:hypothetical protein
MQKLRHLSTNKLWMGIIALTVLGTGCTASQPNTASSPTVNSPSPLPSPPVISSPPPVQASPNVSTGLSEKPDASGNVALADGRIRFTVPAGFTQMSKEEIATKFPRTANPPSYAYANDKRSVTIALTLSPAKVRPEQLPELKTALRPQISKAVPGLEWLKDELIPLNNTQWVRYEFVSPAIDTKVHNDAYFTSFDGKMIGFNFNSTVAEWDAAQAELMKTRDSIVIQ